MDQLQTMELIKNALIENQKKVPHEILSIAIEEIVQHPFVATLLSRILTIEQNQQILAQLDEMTIEPTQGTPIIIIGSSNTIVNGEAIEVQLCLCIYIIYQ